MVAAASGRGMPGWSLVGLCLAVGANPLHAQRTAAEVPYVTTPPAVVRAMLETASVGSSDVVYDLGSGDGRIVIAAATLFGARGVGVEIDHELVELARRNAREAGVDDLVSFQENDLFQVDLSGASVVTLYLLPIVNYRLQPKLLAELAPGSRVVSHAFDMADWVPDLEFQVDDRWVFYWMVPARVAGEWQWSLGEAEVSAEITQRFQRAQGAVRGTSGEFPMTDVVLEGTDFAFTISMVKAGVPITMRYSGEVEGDEIRGRVEIDGGPLAGSHHWCATRLPIATAETMELDSP
jgi:SAM-dependent methyltransferase